DVERGEKLASQVGRLLIGSTLLAQPGFAQQSTGALGKTGEEEGFGKAILRVDGPHTVTVVNPGFCTEVFKVQPDGTWVTGGHGVYVVRGKVAGKGLNHHVSDLGRGSFRGPENYLDPADHLLGVIRGAGPEPAQCLDVVQPKAHRQVVFPPQLTGKAPADADVAVVVDHATKDVPTLRSLIKRSLHGIHVRRVSGRTKSRQSTSLKSADVIANVKNCCESGALRAIHEE